MSPVDFEKAAEKALKSKGKGKNRTPKAPTKHQLELEAQNKGLEVLAEVQVPEHVEEPVVVEPEPVVEVPVVEEVATTPVAAGLAAMKSHPKWADILKVADLYEQAGQAETDYGNAMKEVEDLTKEAARVDKALWPAQQDYEKECRRIKDGIMGDPDITFKRALREVLRGQFSKMVELGVQAAIKEEPKVFELQSRLARLTAEAEKIRIAKESASHRAIKSRERSKELTKQAAELAAKVSL